MSRENVMVVRALHELRPADVVLGRRDLTDLFDPEIEWLPRPSAWEEARSEVQECRELEGERVLVLYRFSGRGKTRGLEAKQMQAKAANLFHVGDSKVTRLVLYWDRERALADLGLTRDPGSQPS